MQEAVNIVLDPSTPRQLGEEGLVVFWRDGGEPGRREGLACILSMCTHAECACQLVYVDGFVIDEQASAVSWDEDGVHITVPAGTVMLEEKMIAIVDPDSGETTAHPDLPDATDPALVDWLASEMDEELLEVLHRYRARSKGYLPEHPRKDIDLDAVEEIHLAAFDELFEGVRSDAYLLGGRRYWTCIFLCPSADCDCHQLRVAFFDDEAEPDSGDTVGSVLLDLGGTEGFKRVRMQAECGAPEHLIRELWALFERRHRVGPFLRRREAQAKAVGATLWHLFARPVRAEPQPGRNDPCPCGSGVKFKKCCLGQGAVEENVMTEIPSEYRGWWRITETSQWVNDGLDMLGPALLSLTGYADRLRMHCLLAYVNCKPTKTGVSFTWEGAWEFDQLLGSGRVTLRKDGRLKGTFRIKDGDPSTFTAVRAEEPDEPIPPPPSYRDKWRRRW